MPESRDPSFCIWWRTATEAKEGLDAWREGELTFEEAMMEVVKSLFLAHYRL